MQLMQEYLEYLEIERGRSRKTIDNYQRYLGRFVSFSGVRQPSDITDELVRTYRLRLNRENLDKHTQNYHLIALRGFLKYLVKRRVSALPPEAIELVKTGARDIDLIDADDLDRLFGVAGSEDSFAGMRDHALLELLFSTGLRVSELCALNRDSVSEKKNEFSVRGKGGKIRVVFIAESARSVLKQYLEKRGDVSPALFVSAPKGKKTNTEPTRLTSRSVERIIKKRAIEAGISKKVTPHTLRHMFATDLLVNGADIRSVQSMLGHANIATTQVYTHLTDRQLREIHQAFHGRRRKKASR